MFNYGQNRPLPGLRLGCAGCLLESPDPQPKTCVNNIFIKMWTMLVMLIGGDCDLHVKKNIPSISIVMVKM